MNMINLNNFKGIIDWPTFGFLHNDNMLSDEDFALLNAYDFRNCQLPAAEGNRRMKQFWLNQPFDESDPVEMLIKRLLTQLNSWDVLKKLIEDSLAANNLVPSDVWNGTIEDVESHYLGVFCAFNEDSDAYYLKPHRDSRPVMQLYISPDGAPVGTRFHVMEDHSIMKQLPFKANTGYFQLPLKRGVHSAMGADGVTRRSLLFGWNMMYSNNLHHRNI
jgi:hypothetical protein